MDHTPLAARSPEYNVNVSQVLVCPAACTKPCGFCTCEVLTSSALTEASDARDRIVIRHSIVLRMVTAERKWQLAKVTELPATNSQYVLRKGLAAVLQRDVFVLKR
jgi:hypothetical protein